MANVLPRCTQLAVLGALVEGCSIRSTERMFGVHCDTIMRLGVGEGCAVLLDETMRDLPCERLELDELWSFVGKKRRRLTRRRRVDVGSDRCDHDALAVVSRRTA